MKKNTIISLLLLLSAVIFHSCKKNNSDTAKDYTAAIKDKTWWGQLTYTGKTTEYFCVHFNTNNTLLWNQLSGDYTGKWTLNSDELKMTFDASSAEINAKITGEDKLSGISDNTGSYEINNGQLITTPNLYIDNTSWAGTFTTNSQQFQFNFTQPLKVEAKFGTTTFGPYFYSRIMSGEAIRFNIPAFGGNTFAVIISSNEMRGSTAMSNSDWKAIKQ